MSATSETPATERQILLVGPYGVLGTGVIDAVAGNPKWGITTAAQAGFADCIDTHQSFRRQLTRLPDMRIIP